MERYKKLKTIDGYTISGAHTIAKSKSIVLWLHGITVNKDEYLEFFKDGAKYLETKGIDSLRIDFRGHGESSGASLDFSIAGQILDVKTALNYIRRSYSKKQIKIHIVGCSFGAPPAIYSAARYPGVVKSLILIAPVLSYNRTFLKPETEWGQSIFNKNTLSKMAKTKQLFIDDNFPVSIRLIEEMKLLHPDCSLKEVKQEIVLIHGDKDSMVPFEVSKNVAKDIPKIKFMPFHGMDHGFMDANDENGTSKKSIKNKTKIYEIIAEQCL